jgi:predicted phosphodiesterase
MGLSLETRLVAPLVAVCVLLGAPSAVGAGWPKPAARIAVAGDVGTEDGTDRARTARAMERFDRRRPFDALLLLGDNVYPRGNPKELGERVFRPFAPVLSGRTQLLGLLGNHDVLDGNGPGQVRRLGMPGRYYVKRLGPVRLIVLDSTQPNDKRQLRWLGRALRSNAPWTVVALHHPLYSAGHHGSSLEVRAAVGPILARHAVDLVLAGHEHDYQRTKAIGGTVHVVSGGAAWLRPTGSDRFTAHSASTLHFTEINAWKSRLMLRAIDQRGRAFDKLVLTRGARR